MEIDIVSTRSTQSADKYILRFEQPGHRDRLKEQAERAKRTLNKQILALIEAGEAVLYPKGGKK